MALAQRLHLPEPRHRAVDNEGAVWVMVVILLGLACFAFVRLLNKLGG